LPSKAEYGLDDFEIRAMLGEGSFGRVYLVRLLENQKMHFAMKVISK
jgi:serine/threonine protein kinase